MNIRHRILSEYCNRYSKDIRLCFSEKCIAKYSMLVDYRNTCMPKMLWWGCEWLRITYDQNKTMLLLWNDNQNYWKK